MNELEIENYHLKSANQRLWEKNEMFRAAAQKFIDKVDTGRAKSVETYKELKEALEFSKKQ